MRSQRRLPEDIYSQIIAKFIINLPKEQLSNSRAWFHYQKAYFYYVDNEKHQAPRKHLNQSESTERNAFFETLNKYAPKRFRVDPRKISEDIDYYSQNIPVYGAILINQRRTKAVCIITKEKASFPKGKIDQGQTPQACAIRQVWEEIGFDITGKFKAQNKLSAESHGKVVTFFIVYDIKEQSVAFKTQCATEVDRVEWIAIQDYERVRLNKVTSQAFKKLRQILKNPKILKPAQKSKYQIFVEAFEQYANSNTQVQDINPFENFKLDRVKLLRIFN